MQKYKRKFTGYTGGKLMPNYAYGYCGMPCALCTRYRTAGKSKCPGCSHDGYYTEPCKFQEIVKSVLTEQA